MSSVRQWLLGNDSDLTQDYKLEWNNYHGKKHTVSEHPSHQSLNHHTEELFFNLYFAIMDWRIPYS